jgi:hypothetical protein
VGKFQKAVTPKVFEVIIEAHRALSKTCDQLPLDFIGPF